MRELFSQLNEKEREQLRLLGLLALAVFLVFVFISLGQRRGYIRALNSLQAKEKPSAELERKRASSVAEWASWEEAAKDIEDLKKSYFYKEEDGINGLRLDLQKILLEAGINARLLRFDYADLAKEKIKRVYVTFNFTGSYPMLKRFLAVVERFPKFLVLEKIDFLKIGSEGNALDLKIILAGYYANF